MTGCMSYGTGSPLALQTHTYPSSYSRCSLSSSLCHTHTHTNARTQTQTHAHTNTHTLAAATVSDPPHTHAHPSCYVQHGLCSSPPPLAHKKLKYSTPAATSRAGPSPQPAHPLLHPGPSSRPSPTANTHTQTHTHKNKCITFPLSYGHTSALPTHTPAIAWFVPVPVPGRGGAAERGHPAA